MEIRVLKSDEKKLVSYLCYEDCYHITNNEFFDDNKLNSCVILGCFDKELIGCLVLNQFVKIEHLFISKKYNQKLMLPCFISYIKKLCINKIIVEVYDEYFQYFQDAEFVAVKKYHDSILFEYTYNIVNRFSSYEEVYTFITSQKNIVSSLNNFKNYMKEFGYIQYHLNCVHVGGTNGKGSTTNYIRNVLQLEGYKVATLTSPALVSRLDVIRINNEPISEDEYVCYANRYMDDWLEYQLSMFEIEVFIAIIHFINHGVDFAVFEVGLGGEFDATNIIIPLISVITNIGLDHVEYLGDTYEKIAKTKAGIIKEHSAFVTFETKQSCLDIFKDICKYKDTEFIEIGEIKDIKENLYSIEYNYKNNLIQLNTSALYQCYNSALAFEVLSYLKRRNYIHLSTDNMLLGLKTAQWQGRFEIVCEKPLIIIDGAHNKEGIESFYNSARKFDNIKVIFSALKDKDTHTMIKRLLDLTDDVTICEFDFYRAQSAKELAEDFEVKIQKDWKNAVDEAFLHDGVTFVTGSLYFISQVRPYILNKQKL